MKSKLIAALATSAALMWGSAHAAPEPAEVILETPDIIVLELQPIPGIEAGSEQEHAILTMLLMQVLSAMQAEGENVEVQLVTPQRGERI